ncbi:hypothetical protein chiPu_0027206 [Chiloscyllium punctatum]|uniref:Uncharacterized protein n=1 Tax=Chiloscyllium punctatum TaxID=137246 RepID=A0A401TJR6_CHIPU|nr:hypothetical protein [Chiloscyllium punctatum]
MFSLRISCLLFPFCAPSPTPPRSPLPGQDLVKSHLMYAVREEVEVLKEQIKELIDRNSLLERENALLKSLAKPEQLSQLQAQLRSPASTASGSSGSSPPTSTA